MRLRLAICGLRIDALADKAARNPRPRKYPPKYPRCGRAKSPVISRTCEKYPQYPQYPPDVGDVVSCACIRHAWTFADKAASTDKSTRHAKIHKISTRPQFSKTAWLLAFMKISTISTKSTGCHGCVSHACVSMRAKVRAGDDLSPTVGRSFFSRF